MAPSTRKNLRITPSPEPVQVGCYTTPKRRDFYRDFYRDFDKDCATKSMRAICRDNNIDESTGRLWKKQRENFGSMAVRRTRGISKKLWRPSKISKSTCKILVDPRRNPVRKQPYEVMIQRLIYLLESANCSES
jgi:hypothetical protein